MSSTIDEVLKRARGMGLEVMADGVLGGYSVFRGEELLFNTASLAELRGRIRKLHMERKRLMKKEPLVYVASKASVEARVLMWHAKRLAGWNISSTWIDRVGAGEIKDWAAFWDNIRAEIGMSDGLILYGGVGDVMKGALVEVGIALGMRKPIAVVIEGNPSVVPVNIIGSWVAMHSVRLFDSLDAAYAGIAASIRVRKEER